MIKVHLSPRQKQIAKLISEGLSNKEIAARLRITEHTVCGHIQILFARLRARNRAQAACLVLSNYKYPPINR